MADIALTHQLYLYRLLDERLGVGRQANPAQIEEVLASDDIAPIDVGAQDLSELLEALSAFVKVTTYKRGRVVVTVLRNDEFDMALAKAAEAPATKTSAKGKPWKGKAAKATTPTKPKPAPERFATAATTKDEAARDEQGAAAAKETASPSSMADTQTNDGEASPAPVATARDAATDADDAKGEATTATNASGPTPASDEGQVPKPWQTATIQAGQEAQAELMAAATTPQPRPADDEAEATDEVDLGGRISLTITYDPATVTAPLAPQAQEGVDVTARSQVGLAHSQRSRRPTRETWQTDQAPSPTPALKLPGRFSEDVRCADDDLLKILAALPFDADCWQALDAAWDEAAKGDHDARQPISFSLAGDDGSLVTVTIRRRPPTPSGRRWRVMDVEVTPGGEPLRAA